MRRRQPAGRQPTGLRAATPRRRRDRQATLLAVAVMLLIAAADAASGHDVGFMTAVVSGPLVASALVTPGITAALGVAAVGLAVLLGIPDRIFLHGDHVARVVTVLLLSALAVWVASVRTRRERQLARVTAVAEAAQRAIIRPVPDELRGVRMSARYRSATTEAKVGGDLYDVLDSPYGVRLLLGDARGKGLDAVRLASVVLGCFREVGFTRADLRGVVDALDATTRRNGSDEDFVTAVVGELDGLRLRLLVCGHPPPVLIRGPELRLLGPPGAALPLGLGGSRQPVEVDLVPGDRLVLYTDGLVEARDDSGAFFDLPQALAAMTDLPADAALDALLGMLDRHAALGSGDDVALVLLAVPE